MQECGITILHFCYKIGHNFPILIKINVNSIFDVTFETFEKMSDFTAIKIFIREILKYFQLTIEKSPEFLYFFVLSILEC